MATLTLKQAKEILGKSANGISDEVLEGEIETATILKDLFFNEIIKNRNSLAMDSQTCHNMEAYGKESRNLH